jgi:hypothetical protein
MKDKMTTDEVEHDDGVPRPPGPAAPVSRPGPDARRRWLRYAAAAGALIVVFAVGMLAGNAVQSVQTRISNRDVATLQRELATARHTTTVAIGQRNYARSVAASARSEAANATATANRQAQQKWAGKMAAADALLSKLRHEQTVVQQNTISADGVYVVGQDIASGIYHTPGLPGGGSTLNQCYYATLNSTNTSDIIDNNNFGGPETVDVSGAHAFQISGGCTWTKIG